MYTPKIIFQTTFSSTYTLSRYWSGCLTTDFLVHKNLVRETGTMAKILRKFGENSIGLISAVILYFCGIVSNPL